MVVGLAYGVVPRRPAARPYVSQSVSQLFHGPAPRSPLHLKLSMGWGGKCTRSHVCCLGPVCGLRSAKDERLGTRWCTEPDAQSRMHFIIRTLFWYFLFSIPYFLFRFSVSIASHLRTHQDAHRLAVLCSAYSIGLRYEPRTKMESELL